ncbi:MAG: alpha/beta fold hydrolase, partial [Sphingomonadales bacterium]
MDTPQLQEGPVKTDRLTIHALRSMPERPEGRVLILGGSNFDLRLKRQFLETELAYRFEILTYEPRGIGRTEQPEGDWDMADYAADAAALLNAVGWEHADVLGESFGGMTALHLAQTFPERVARLALASATAGGPGGSSVDIRKLLEGPQRKAAADALKLLDTDNSRLEAQDPAKFAARLSARLEFDAGFATPSVTSGGYARLLAARARHDIWTSLPDINQNTIVITGTRDAQAPPGAQTAMARQLPNSEHWTYECGHGVAFATQEPMRDLCAAWSR